MSKPKVTRRRFLPVAAGAATLPMISHGLRAEAYPNRPVHFLVGFAAGGPLDIGARLIAQALSERFGQSFIVENRPGASSNLAAETVVRALPDGYTLLVSAGANSWNTALYDKLSFDFLRDIVPVASFARVGGIMEVNPSVPATTVPEFIAYAKANPGKINMASAGPGSGPGLWGELFKVMAGVNLTTVNYRGSAPALPDLIAGQTQVMFDVVSSSIGHVRAGRLRALGVTTATRFDVLPDVPPIGDFVPGYEAISWNGIGAPKNTPAEIVETLNRNVNACLAEASFKAKLADLGLSPFASSVAEFSKFVPEYTAKWAKVIRAAGIKAE